ncbi:MAG: PTS 2-O-a-mannosyl-D-glycerate transporter subunit IIABC [Fusobacteriales bacterium]|jgi:2-O-A-mannosyl-D-glycerate-specific PTS system IIC component|nr:PTS 2-O-a-mannosyl-D-glycerate transporter subunit IIABC [Fusobacteriales bacterium]
MNLKKLTNEDLVILKADYKSKQEALEALAEKLYKSGKISDKAGYLKDVEAREKQGATNVGMKLAIPHGKSAFVLEPCFAAATVKTPIKDWEKTDENSEDTELIFLIAVPDSQSGNTHIEILTKLTSKLADEELIEKLLKADNEEKFLEILSEDEVKEESKNVDRLILGVTACPAGIAHTYMAAESLEKAGRKLNVKVRTEKQGANGIEGRFTGEELAKAEAVIFAVEVAVKERERFMGIPSIEVPVAEPIKNGEELIKKALEIAKKGRSVYAGAVQEPERKLSFREETKRAILTGISYIVPLIIAGGMLLAIATLMKQTFHLEALWDQENSWLWMYRRLSGGLLGTLMVPILAAYISFSISDKPGLAPGFAAGFAANLINSGFLGGLVGGFLAGYIMKWIKANIKGGKTITGFLNFFLYPVVGTFVVGTLMMFVVGKPVAWLNTTLTDWLNAMQGANAILLGAVIGAMVSFDLGGPVNKAAYAFCLGAMGNGNLVPYAAFASVKMVSAFTATLATKLKPHYFLEEERELGNSTWILGLAGITEGAIPMALNDPFRILGAFVAGSIVTGAMVVYFKLGLGVPGAGILSMLFMNMDGAESSMAGGVLWLIAALIGTAISTVLLLILKGHKYKKSISK